MKNNKTWTHSILPSGLKPITCKWIFKIKYKVDVTIQKYKVHIIARGFTQVLGVDFGDTFSPMVKLTIVWILLALTTQYDLEVHQLDVNFFFQWLHQ